MRPSWLSLGFIGLVQASSRLRPVLWRWWYNSLASKDKAGQLLFMNYGYADDDRKLALVLRPEDEPFRFSIQLYAKAVSEVDLKDKDLLEVGCGRGGGGTFLIRYHEPRAYTGVDLSESAVRWCKQNAQFSNARWLQGAADALPVPNECMDVVVNVESSHCYPSLPAFLSEVVRVLRPGGYFAFCDMRTTERIAELEGDIERSGLRKIERREITQQVLRALECISGDRETQIARSVPRLLRPVFRDFVASKDTVFYDMLAKRKMVYVSYLLQKPVIN